MTARGAVRFWNLSLWAAVTAVGLSACDVYDIEPALAALDAGDVEPADAGMDSGEADTGPPDAAPDTGPPPLALADNCGGEIPLVMPSMGSHPSTGTLDLSDDFGMYVQCGISQPGPWPEGFFRLNSLAGRRWHIMIRPDTETMDVLAAIVPSCDDRNCLRAADACGPGGAEHFNFVPDEAGDYLVSVETSEPGPVQYMVLSPPCGDGSSQHGETCDDGNSRIGDGCTPQCQAELEGSMRGEVEPNGDLFEKNVLFFRSPTGNGGTGSMKVTGNLGGLCDVDRFAVIVPAGGSLQATLLTGSGEPCPTEQPVTMMRLMDPSTDLQVGRGSTGRAGGECPAIDGSDAFATDMAGGEYHIVLTTEGQPDVFPYQLDVTVSGPPM